MRTRPAVAATSVARVMFAGRTRESIRSRPLTTSGTTSTLGLTTSRRLKASSWRVRPEARSVERRMASRSSWFSSASGRRCLTRVAQVRMAVSRLLKSWATPPASWPTASSFWAWRSWPSRSRRPLSSEKNTATPVTCAPSRMGLAVQATGTGVPSARWKRPSAWRRGRPWSRGRRSGQSAAAWGASPMVPSWTSAWKRAPTRSSRDRPRISAAAGFARVTRPSGSRPTMPSSAEARSRLFSRVRLESPSAIWSTEAASCPSSPGKRRGPERAERSPPERRWVTPTRAVRGRTSIASATAQPPRSKRRAATAIRARPMWKVVSAGP